MLFNFRGEQSRAKEQHGQSQRRDDLPQSCVSIENASGNAGQAEDGDPRRDCHADRRGHRVQRGKCVPPRIVGFLPIAWFQPVGVSILEWFRFECGHAVTLSSKHPEQCLPDFMSQRQPSATTWCRHWSFVTCHWRSYRPPTSTSLPDAPDPGGPGGPGGPGRPGELFAWHLPALRVPYERRDARLGRGNGKSEHERTIHEQSQGEEQCEPRCVRCWSRPWCWRRRF